MHHQLPKPRRSGAAAIALACILAGCGDPADDNAALPTSGTDTNPTATGSTTSSSTTTSTTAPPSSTVPTPDDGEAFDEYIANRVEAFYTLRDEALAAPTATPEEDFPGFADLAGEPQLSVMYDAIRGLHSRNQAYREIDDPIIGTTTDEEHRTSGIQTRDGNVVTAFNCEVDDDDVVNTVTGEIEIEGTLTILRVVSIEFLDDQWKVTKSEVSQKIEGVAGCYLASDAEFPF
jgi:hypothetical protein